MSRLLRMRESSDTHTDLTKISFSYPPYMLNDPTQSEPLQQARQRCGGVILCQKPRKYWVSDISILSHKCHHHRQNRRKID